ncbi:AfsR/SARP family transcriptional regulator [Streptomyces sp. NBC_00893]|uniref:AfsR/SARP family transcriptional regulator n=1 Tax=Streptomyces sp. NBC_00893 TaxID=2975862 RepID=UPI0022581D9F|nr:AfsR/SARP family transcriptional regulator [Streptomyces sp. NBC_00893]MCX4849532.1 winged helix-turn-helix domain-containing protein [Streptomyces sp. NBC_00893]
MRDEDLSLQLLGPIRARRGAEEVVLGPPKQRAVLGLLASRVNEVVSVEQVVDAVWGTDVPQTAVNGVHTYVAGLRRALEPGRDRRAAGGVVVSMGGGYLLRMEADSIDAGVFARALTEARRSRAEGDPAGALTHLDTALGLWRGEAYAGVPGPFADIERTRLRELRLTAIEEWAADMLRMGRHSESVAVLSEALVTEQLRERLRWLLMLALYRCGRQAQALSVYQETRQILQDELGIEPGSELRHLHAEILAGDPGIGVGDSAAIGPEALTAVTRTAPQPSPAGAAPLPPTDEVPAREAPRPAQLPSGARGFAGRNAELAALRQIVVPGRGEPGADTTTCTVVIEGPVGVGKTELALRLAHEVTDHYRDGQLYVDLSGTRPQEVPLTSHEALGLLLGSLGVEESRTPGNLAARTALYRSLLFGRRMLLVLDDALNPEQLRPLIPRGPSCVLITSRHHRQSSLAAREGAHRVLLGPLERSESAELITCLVGRERTAGQEQAVERLAQMCGHLPLALRIASEALAANPGVSVAMQAARYAVERAQLEHAGLEDDATVSLRTTFQAMYRSLPLDAARMFRLLGQHHAAVITVAAAASLTGLSWDEARKQLETLADSHLMEATGLHLYRFHGLVACYAAECAQEEAGNPEVVQSVAREEGTQWLGVPQQAVFYPVAGGQGGERCTAGGVRRARAIQRAADS